MNDTMQRITDLVRAEVKKLAMGEPVGLVVTQGFVPIQTPQGMQLTAGWVVTVDTRNPLLGQDRLAFPVIIPSQPGYMPSDKAFLDSAKMALDGVRKLHDESLSQMNNVQQSGPEGTIDGTGLVIGK